MSKADREYAAAQKQLAEVSKRDQAETSDYLDANQKAAEAAANVSWWKR